MKETENNKAMNSDVIENSPVDGASEEIDFSRTDDNDNDNDEISVNSIDQAPQTSLLKVLSLAKPERLMLGIAVLIMVAAEATGLINPKLLGKAYDNLLDYNQTPEVRMENVNRTMIIIMILHFGGCILTYLRFSILLIIGERVVSRLRCTLYRRMLSYEIYFFDVHKSGELVSRLSSDTALLQEGTSQSLPEVCIGLIKVIVSIVIMFLISARLSALLIAFLIIVMCLAIPFGRLLGRLSKQYQNLLGIAQSYSTEALQAMRTVQSFCAEEKEADRYQSKIGHPANYPYWFPKQHNKKSSHHHSNQQRYNMISSNKESESTKTSRTSEILLDDDQVATTYSVGFQKALTQTAVITIIFGVGFGGMYITLWYGFKLVNENAITLGDLTAFQSYIFIIGGAIGASSQALTKLMEAQGVSGRIFYLLERQPKIPTYSNINNNDDNENINLCDGNNDPHSPSNLHDVPEEKGDTNDFHPNGHGTVTLTDMEAPLTPLTPDTTIGMIEFKNVTFAYPSRPDVNVLQNLTLTIPANKTTALVGASGCGKSTCIALLQRFYDVSSGSILIDGQDIQNVDLRWLRSNMAYVQQEPQLFGVTIRENILYGIDPTKRTVTDEELIEVTKTANAHDFISNWPNKYETLVGERGVQLSGGQKQRISIARALMCRPKILLLDEATASLDAESEYLVQQAIENAVVGRTVIVVAHRLSTIQNAHQIVVIDHHKIVDIGTHSELLNRCTKYQDLIKRQAIIAK